MLAGALAFQFLPLTAFAQLPSPRVVSPETEKRIQLARERGFWIIEEGDYLYRIARNFAPDEAGARVLVDELRELNPNALMNGAAAKLVVGARLHLPRRLLVAPDASATAQAPPLSPPAPATAPPVSVPPIASAPPRTPIAAPPRAPGAAGAISSATPPAPMGVPPIAPGAPAPTPAPPIVPPVVASAYTDRTLMGVSEEQELGLDNRPRDGSPGLKQWGVELRSEHREHSTAGTTQADGVAFRYAMETERYGDFALLGQVTHFRSNPPRGEEERVIGSATLIQENFGIAPGWFATSSLGVVRPILPFFLTTSYRVNMSTSMLSGFQTSISSPQDEIRLGVGRIGQLTGFGIQQFERSQGEQATAAYARRLNRDWSVGAAAIAVRDSLSVPDHVTTTIGIDREFNSSGPGVKAQVALTDDQQAAGWFDSQVRSGRMMHRFGAYYVDPDFKFGDGGSARDTRGAYWRGEYRGAANFYGFGIETSSDNLERNPERGGSDNIGGYANATLRLDRTLQVGGGGSMRQEDPRTAGGIPRKVGYANLFLSKTWGLGVTRLDANTNTSRPTTGFTERTNYVAWYQDWPRLGSVDLQTQLSQTNENLERGDTIRRLASVTARGPLYGNLQWDATLSYVDVDDPRGSERNYNAAVSLDWNPAPSWTVLLTWFRNSIQPGADNLLSPFVKENALQLTVRYEGSSGTPYPGVSGGRSSTGRVTGSIFYDENGDGVRQANERGAPGVQVILDDRQAAVTDSDGRYTFALVPAGVHRLRVSVDRVPLPWGLDDETPREVRVDVRGDVRTDVGLKRVAP
ncbi:hypothetical protein DSM104440_00677 [Usitatibacter palustris]|uniref:Uncharacterized protein n=2 Tax=Usitatibacter palustris TaxID=2732487 RepID=A0A6M4H7C7_9PROT|nr:hypothetical protein DSM104440_00677 [Usitatibacter palustris]